MGVSKGRCGTRILAAVFVLVASAASAQPIHGHPQKAFYASPAEYPVVPAQGHWMLGGVMSHAHVEPRCPYLAEGKTGDQFTCTFTIVTFLGGVHVDALYAGIHKGNAVPIVWDATGSETMPPIDGEAGKVKTWTGHFTATIPVNATRWWFFTAKIAGSFSDGTDFTDEAMVPFWADQEYTGTDPFTYHLPTISSRFRVRSRVHPEGGATSYGETSVETADLIPLAPISVPWTIKVSTYSYGGVGLGPSVSEARRDLDLHNGIPGVELWSVNQVDDLIGVSLTFDPVAGEGAHKYAVLRTVPLTDEMHTALLVFSVIVDPKAPPVPYGQPDTVPVPTTNPPPPSDPPVKTPVFRFDGSKWFICRDASFASCKALN